MPRHPRVHIDNLPLHIIQRGHNQEACFFCDADYKAYLHWLGEVLKKESCTLHAYCLMKNHIHLLVTPEYAESISSLIIALSRKYVQYINKTYHRTGTLWDSRYKSSLIQEETYLLACQRYIELNPVRASMVKEPALYRWSSYRFNALGKANQYVSPHSVYLSLGKNSKSRQIAYRSLFQSELDTNAFSDIRLAITQSQPLGNSHFYAKLETMMMGQLCSPKPRGRPKKQKYKKIAKNLKQ
ncbi:MAG: transposase [Gammaproteobacteria bacterium]|nr:MAG: transposase [Gammaproteobacteria bacterium]RKZ72412.1 MAG: transposase [Gammaproteobacteria bacterium]